MTVITRNESANIEAALASVAWADEIVVVDSESTDDTAAIARRHTRAGRDAAVARVQRAEELRRVAAPRTTGSCRSTPTSASRRRWRRRSGRCSRSEPPHRGYRVPRISHYLGRWIRGTDWYPDYQLRLYDRRAGEWNGRRVHESVRAEGRAGPARARPAALSLPRHQPPPRHDRPLHDARRRADARPTAGGRRSPASPCIRRLRSCATTSCAEASRTAAPASSSRR